MQQSSQHFVCRQRDTAQQKETLELELLALKKSMGAGRAPIARRGSQVLLGASADGVVPNSPSASVAEARADRLARQLEEAEQQIDAMSIKVQQQVRNSQTWKQHLLTTC